MLLHDVEIFGLGSGFGQDLIDHAVAAHHFGDLLRLEPKFIDIDVTAPLKLLQHLLQMEVYIVFLPLCLFLYIRLLFHL